MSYMFIPFGPIIHRDSFWRNNHSFIKSLIQEYPIKFICKIKKLETTWMSTSENGHMNYEIHMLEYYLTIKNHLNKYSWHVNLKERTENLNTTIPVLKEIHTYYIVCNSLEGNTDTYTQWLFLKVVLQVIWIFFYLVFFCTSQFFTSLILLYPGKQ